MRTAAGVTGNASTQSATEIRFASDAAAGVHGIEIMTTSFNAVAGRTYTFSFNAYGSLGDQTRATSNHSLLRLKIAGDYVGPQYDTDGPTQLSMNEGSPTVVTLQWTAPSSGATSLQFEFRPLDRGTKPYNDNIVASIPSITCV